MFRLKPIWIAVAVVLVGLGIGYGLEIVNVDSAPHEDQETVPVETLDRERVAITQVAITEADTVYICPMNCVAPMEKPGRCPVCGMALVASTDQAQRHGAGVTLDEETIQAAGIRLAPVARRVVSAEIRLFGKIEYDPIDQYKVTAFAPGVIDRIYVKRAGQSVRRGDPLFDMHSSELYFLEEALFEVLKEFPDTLDYRPARGEAFKRRMRPARRSIAPPKGREESAAEKEKRLAATAKIAQIQRKMQLLGLSKSDIDTIMARSQPTGISTVTTPTTGIVLEQNAFKGAYVNTGEAIFTIANPRYLWAKLDAYESDFAWLRLGQEAEFETDAFPGRTFKGKVTYLDPFFDQETRTFKVGVLYIDAESDLKPNMLVRAVILARMTEAGGGTPGRGDEEKAPLVIPETAPLITGKRAIVYVAVHDRAGAFEARQVTLGPRAKGYFVVRHGLEEGDQVVVNGNFKIDSAVQVLAKPSMMEPEGAEPAGMHLHTHSQAGEAEAMMMKTPMRPQGNGLEHSGPQSAGAHGGSPANPSPLKGPQHKLYGGPQADE